MKYIELKTGHADNGPAWVARVRASKSGEPSTSTGGRSSGLICRPPTTTTRPNQEAYWVSGIKKDGLDRHWAGSGKVAIETGVIQEYLRVTGSAELDLARFEVIEDLPPTDPASFLEQENTVLPEQG